MYVEKIIAQHQKNMAKHGEQPLELLRIVLAEEIGEIARACLEFRWGGNPDNIRNEIIDSLAVLLAMSEDQAAYIRKLEMLEREPSLSNPEQTFEHQCSDGYLFALLRWVDSV